MQQRANFDMSNVKGYQSFSSGSVDYITNSEIVYHGSNNINKYDDVEEIDYSDNSFNGLTPEDMLKEKIRMRKNSEFNVQKSIYRKLINYLSTLITNMNKQLNDLKKANKYKEDLNEKLILLSPYGIGMSTNFPICLFDEDIAEEISKWASDPEAGAEFYQIIELLEYFGVDDFFSCIEPDDYVEQFMNNVRNGKYREFMFESSGSSLDVFISDNFKNIVQQLCGSYIINGDITFDLDEYSSKCWSKNLDVMRDELRNKIQSCMKSGYATLINDIMDCLIIICSNQEEVDFYLEQINNISIEYDDVISLKKYVDDLKKIATAKMIEDQFGDVFNREYNLGYEFKFNSLEGKQSLNSLTENYLDELYKLDKNYINKNSEEYLSKKSDLEFEYLEAMYKIIRYACSDKFDNNNLPNIYLSGIDIEFPNLDDIKESFYFALKDQLVSEYKNNKVYIAEYQRIIKDITNYKAENQILLTYTTDEKFQKYVIDERYLKDIDSEILDVMNVDEKKIYSFLSKEYGKAVAEEYYAVKKDEFHKRAGMVRAAKFLDSITNSNGEFKDFSEMTEDEIAELDAMLYDLGLGDHLSIAGKGFVDGLEMFAEGILNNFCGDGIKSINEYEAMFISAFLESDSSASMTYEISTSIGNMAVPIIVSALISFPTSHTAYAQIGKLISSITGSSLMGASVMGNSYEEGLQAGMSEGAARVYGLLCGVSETTLELFLGGIPGFSLIDEVSGLEGFLLGMFKEGFEESTQSMLEPFLEYIATGEYQPVDPNEVLKSGFYGMITGGIISGFYSSVETFVPEAVKIIKKSYDDACKMGIVAPGFVPVEAFQSVEAANAYVNQLMESPTGASVVGYTLSEFKSMIESGGLNDSILSELNKLSVSDKLKLAWELDGYAGWIGFTDIRGMTFFVENGFLKAKINWPAYGGMKLSSVKQFSINALNSLLNELGINGIEINNGIIKLDRIGGKGGGTYALLNSPIYSTNQRSILNDMNNPNNAYRQINLDINKYKTFCDGAFDLVKYVTENNISIDKISFDKLNDYPELAKMIENLGNDLGLDMESQESYVNIIAAVFADKGSYYADMQPGNRPDILDIHNQGKDSKYGYVGEAAEWLSDTGEKITDGGAVQFNLRSSEAALENLGIIESTVVDFNGGE